MNREELMARCIDEIRDGKATLDDCLCQYPQLSDELPSLMEVAAVIQPEELTPSAEFIARAESRLFEAMGPAPAPAEGRVLDLFGWFKPPALARHAVMIAIIVAAVVGGSAGAYATSVSLPGSVLYPLKTATEGARLAATPSDAGKAELHIAFAERRIEEMAAISIQGEVAEMPALTDALAQHLEQAESLAGAVAAAGIDTQALTASLEESAAEQLGILESALDAAPEEARLSLEQALLASGEEYGGAIEAAVSANPPLLAAGMGTVQIRASDPPSPDAESVLVEVESIEIHRAAGADSEWISIVGEPVTFDLLKVADVQKLLGSQQVPEGTYTQIRFVVAGTTVIVDGEEHIASVPSGQLKLVRPFQVANGETTLLLLDFDGERSLKVTGSGRYKLEPTVKLLVPDTDEQDEEEDEPGLGEQAMMMVAGTEEEPEEEPEPTLVEIEGTVVSFDDGEMVVLVGGEEVIIPIDDDAKVKGKIEIGSWVEVEAVADDGSFVATDIEVEKGGKDKDKPDKDKPDKDKPDKDKPDKDKDKGPDKDKDKGSDKYSLSMAIPA